MSDVKPTRVIDLHTHLFNARCLPMQGIIANLLNKDAKDSWFSRALARLIYATCQSETKQSSWFLADIAAGNHELNFLNAVRVQVGLQKLDNKGQAVVAHKGREMFLSAEAVEEKEAFLALSEVQASLEELGEIPAAQVFSFHGLNNEVEFSRQVNFVVRTAIDYVQSAISKADELATEITNFADFIFCMLASMHNQADTLFARYSQAKVSLQLQVVHHMMDMQYAYAVNGTSLSDTAPKYDFINEQLELARTVAKDNEGRIIGFAAFDPRRLDPTRSDWEHIVRGIWSETGLRGFKFYPAMGYLPYGQTRDSRREYYISEETIAKRVHAFFAWCAKHDVPVFAHCTPIGFQTRFKEGLNTSPHYWRQLLTSTEEMKKLRLCFGHGGGGYATRKSGDKTDTYFGWTGTEGQWDETNFAFQVAKMCNEFPKVYCELAYITELFEGNDNIRETSKANLKNNLVRAANPSEYKPEYSFWDKVAYGSDWNMPSMVQHPSDYLEVFLELFASDATLSIHAEQFFWRNAHSYLKL